MRKVIIARARALILALLLVCALGLAGLTARHASAQGIGLNASGCSYAQNWCGVTVYSDTAWTGVEAYLYGRDVNGYYFTKYVVVYAGPGNPNTAWFWVNAGDRVDIITVSAPVTIRAYGPYVGM